MAGVDTKTSDEKALSTFVQKQKLITVCMLRMARKRDHDIRVQQRRVDKNKLKLFKNKLQRNSVVRVSVFTAEPKNSMFFGKVVEKYPID